jgi:DNA-binding MarR family transcriptional regulator
VSSPAPEKPYRKPLIALIHDADRSFNLHMVEMTHAAGRPEIKPSHNAVVAHLPSGTPRRAADLAAAAGMTRQSMGELVRELVDLGLVEMVPDPDDRRAKLVSWTEEGLSMARTGKRHLAAIEQRLEAEFGEDYEAARRVLERVAHVLDDIGPETSP